MRKSLHLLMALSLTLGTLPGVHAQEAPAPEAVDTALDQLLQLDPQTLINQIGVLKQQAEAQGQEAQQLRAQADSLDQQVADIEARLNGLKSHVDALFAAFGGQPAAAPAEQMAAAPEAPMAEAAMPEATAFTNFDEHIKPLFEQRCARCHNEDTKKSGFSVASFQALMLGGSSGAVVTPGDPDGSRLLRLVSKAEEPFMPPSGDPLPQEQLDLIRKWIQEGALQNASSTPMAKAETAPQEPQQSFVAATFADTPPMPEVELAQAQALQNRGVVARAIDASPRAPLLAAGSDHQVLLYNLDSRGLLGALPFPEGDIFALSFSLNGELLVVGGGEEGNSGLCAVYNVRTGQRIGVYGEAYDTVLAADISPDHRMIAIGGPNKKVRVYSVETAQELYSLEAHTDWIYAVKFTPDGEVLATADRSGGMFLWQAANGRTVEQLRGHEGAIYALDYTPDSLFLTSAGADGTVQIWDTWTYARVRTFKAHNAPVLNLDVSAANLIVTASTDGASKVFNLEGAEQKAFANLGDWGYDAGFSQDGSTVIAGTWTGDIHLWNAASGEALATLSTNPAATMTKVASAQ